MTSDQDRTKTHQLYRIQKSKFTSGFGPKMDYILIHKFKFPLVIAQILARLTIRPPLVKRQIRLHHQVDLLVVYQQQLTV